MEPPLPAHGRLPIHHPEFVYLKSRNIYSDKLQELEGRVFSDNATESRRGSARTLFPAPPAGNPGRAPLHVEIGCNAGHVIVEWAARDPRGVYVGLDWKFKQIFRGVDKARKRRLDNVIFYRAHAERLPYMFGPGEIDHLYLYFPDPWPRSKQWKNRFVNAENLRAVARLVAPGGTFHIKTDHADYFKWMERELGKVESEKLWKTVERNADLHRGHPDPLALDIPDVTLFEKIFIKQRIPIHSLKLERLP